MNGAGLSREPQYSLSLSVVNGAGRGSVDGLNACRERSPDRFVARRPPEACGVGGVRKERLEDARPLSAGYVLG